MTLLSQDFTLGILGGGQLGRMSALAAARLGISVVIFCPEDDSPASKVAKNTIIAAYDDEKALKTFSDTTDIITYEFENIPVKTIEYLNNLKQNTVFPGKKLLHVSQDRITEKQFLNDHDVETTQWSEIKSVNDIEEILKQWKDPACILKTSRFGYDGKGQIKLDSEDMSKNEMLHDFLESTKGIPLIMERFVSFESEISVIIAKDKDGNTETYGPMLNEHKDHILHKTTVPANITKKAQEKALLTAKKIADLVHLRGVLTVEFFVCKDDKVLVNEIAPRTHNSGHWSLDACAVSQFENHVRAVCGLPAVSPARHSDVEMLNLIGHDIDNIDGYLNKPNTCIHLYGKTETRDGRKMGHITFLKPKS